MLLRERSQDSSEKRCGANFGAASSGFRFRAPHLIRCVSCLFRRVKVQNGLRGFLRPVSSLLRTSRFTLAASRCSCSARKFSTASGAHRISSLSAQDIALTTMSSRSSAQHLAHGQRAWCVAPTSPGLDVEAGGRDERGASPPAVRRPRPAVDVQVSDLAVQPGWAGESRAEHVDRRPVRYARSHAFDGPGVQRSQRGSVEVNYLVSPASQVEVNQQPGQLQHLLRPCPHNTLRDFAAYGANERHLVISQGVDAAVKLCGERYRVEHFQLSQLLAAHDPKSRPSANSDASPWRSVTERTTAR